MLANGATEVRRFAFLAQIPDLQADYLQLRDRTPYKEEEIKNLDEAAFRTWVETLPCCVLGGDRKTPGDPLNVVFVGENRALFPALVRQGWHVTESITSGSVWRTISSSLFGTRYRYGPVSPLYAFGRHQDIAVQKARNDVDQRNHMRLWRAPVNLNGTPVWAGQISRDIGVRLTAIDDVKIRISLSPFRALPATEVPDAPPGISDGARESGAKTGLAGGAGWIWVSRAEHLSPARSQNRT